MPAATIPERPEAMTLPRAYIEHVAIRVSDVDRHVDFFRQVLGLTIQIGRAHV